MKGSLAPVTAMVCQGVVQMLWELGTAWSPGTPAAVLYNPNDTRVLNLSYPWGSVFQKWGVLAVKERRYWCGVQKETGMPQLQFSGSRLRAGCV